MCAFDFQKRTTCARAVVPLRDWPLLRPVRVKKTPGRVECPPNAPERTRPVGVLSQGRKGSESPPACEKAPGGCNPPGRLSSRRSHSLQPVGRSAGRNDGCDTRPQRRPGDKSHQAPKTPRDREWTGPDSNRRHPAFQAGALPTELPVQGIVRNQAVKTGDTGTTMSATPGPIIESPEKPPEISTNP